ncbi:MAG: Maf family protein, partial [Thermoanaerobacterium sp.]|nr:Maf family protein [Thermoanaerobacterium sp.]
GYGSLIVERINGDYYNVVGLPISKLYDILSKEFNVHLL